MAVKQWQGGMTGRDEDGLDADLKNVKRLDESWPADEMGNKLSLPATVANCINSLPDKTR